MKRQVVLELGTASGVHLRVMAVLKRHGLKVANLAIAEEAAGGKRLTLEIECDDAVDCAAVRADLEAVAGVARVARFEGEAAAAPRPVVEAATAPTPAEQRFKNPDSEAGDEEIRDRMLVFSLLSRYPKIAGRLVELKGIIPEEDHETRFHQIGIGFGRHLVGNLKLGGPLSGIDALFDRVVVPGIDPLARVVRFSDRLRVDLYRKEFDRGRPSPLHCQFLHGALKGLLVGANTVPGFTLQKTTCMHTSDARCEFRFVPANG